jgi:EAL domain-containing protein (putative c-di-GMP-specific phosphodiesterase class I)
MVCLHHPFEEADLLDAIASVRRRDADPLVAESAAFADAARCLYVAVQPVISWSQQEVVSCELPLRSQHRLLGRPERLRAAAVRHGRIHEPGRGVRAELATCIDDLPSGDVYVNLHPAELEDDALLDPEAPLSRHARRVILDVSAQAGLDRVGAGARVARLRELGFRIALDDVSESSGLGLLAILRPEVLKIDGSLIHGIRRDPLRRALVRGLVDLGARLGATIIAEGVETEDDLTGAVECGADQCSGFLFGRPASRLPALDLRAIRHRMTS